MTFVLAALLAVPLALRVPVDNRIEIFLNPSSQSALQYNQFVEDFGSDEFLLAAYTGKDFFNAELLDLQLDVLETIESLDFVVDVSGIPQVYRDFFGEEDIEALREELYSTPFYDDFLLSKDGSVAALFIEADSMKAGDDRVKWVEDVEEALRPLKGAGFQVYLVGPPALHVMMERATQKEAIRTFPWAFVLSVLVMAFLFRSLRATLAALLSVGTTLLLSLGFMSLAHVSLNMITSALPMLLWVLSLANLIHIFRRYQEDHNEERNPSEDVQSAVKTTALPCAVAMFTTAVGFLSLTTSAMRPLRELGICAAVGLLFSLAVSLGFSPQLLIWMKVPGLKRSRKGRQWTDPISAAVQRWGKIILAATLGLLLLAWLGLGRLSVECNPIRFLPDEDDGARAYAFVGKHLTGLYSMEVVLDFPYDWLDARALSRIEQVASQLSDLEGVARVLSPTDVLKKMNQWDNAADPAYYQIPSPSRSAELVDMSKEMGGAEWDRFLTEKGHLVRLSVLMKEMDSTGALRTADQARELLKALPDIQKGTVTGIALRIAEVQLALVKTQRRSFLAAFCCIFLCILVGLRSWKMTLASFLPNLMPIWVTYGLMGWFTIPLNPATVMVASVALGIAVDDAIHILNAYQYVRGRGRSPVDAVRLALRKVGPAITMTTVTACIGFFALGRSAFAPIRGFGLLSGLAMLVALAGNLFVVPSILTFRDASGGSGDRVDSGQQPSKASRGGPSQGGLSEKDGVS